MMTMIYYLSVGEKMTTKRIHQNLQHSCLLDVLQELFVQIDVVVVVVVVEIARRERLVGLRHHPRSKRVENYFH